LPYLEQINLPKDLKKLKQEELSGLAEELRSEIIRVCSLGGGHLASSLGAIELTIAMHYLFDSAKDRFVWDVGHQTYAHKIITGRKADIDSIRKPNGLAGFTTSSESEHDALTVGHASTSIAAALGMALARDASGQDYEVLAVIGDGALTGGMALAALNQIGQSKPKLTIILNDNEMSISENVGGLKNHLRSLQVQPWYRRAEERGKVALGPLKQVVGRIKDSTRLFFDPISANPFHAMGIRYVGPIDGHNIDQIIYYLDKIKNLEGPSMLHVITQKGKGYDIAEENPIDWHGASKFNLDHPELAAKGYSWSNAFGDAACELAKQDERIWAITPAMRVGSGLVRYSKEHKERYLDVGIAEDVAVTVAAGLALQGQKPIVAIYSTFLQRAVDQIIHDVCIENLDVVFAIDRAGLVGGDGMTHQGVFDISILRSIPNMSIASPKDANELQAMLKEAIKLGGPKAIRWPRGGIEKAKKASYDDWPEIEWGSWEILKEGSEAYILASGLSISYAWQALADNEKVGLINARFIKPLDEKVLASLTNKTLITVEDHALAGGFGSAVLEHIAINNYSNKVVCLGIKDNFVPHGDVKSQHEELGYGPKAIVRELEKLGLMNLSKIEY